MKKIITLAAVAMMVIGSSVYACDTCGCKAKKDKKAECTSTNKACKAECKAGEKKDCSKCTEKKACCEKGEKKACPADCKKDCCKKTE